MEIPILLNHDGTKTIGVVKTTHDNKLVLEFAEDVKITKEMAFDIFGNAGLKLLQLSEESGVFYIRKAQIVEFSLMPTSPA